MRNAEWLSPNESCIDNLPGWSLINAFLDVRLLLTPATLLLKCFYWAICCLLNVCANRFIEFNKDSNEICAINNIYVEVKDIIVLQKISFVADILFLYIRVFHKKFFYGATDQVCYIAMCHM